jgi:hypothetical protein
MNAFQRHVTVVGIVDGRYRPIHFSKSNRSKMETRLYLVTACGRKGGAEFGEPQVDIALPVLAGARRLRRLRRLIGTFSILAQKLVFCNSDLDHQYKNAYDLFVPRGRASYKRTSDGRVSQACISRSCI